MSPIAELRASGYFVGFGVPVELRAGWIELVRWFRVGPDADEKDSETVIGPLVGETDSVFIVDVYGEPMSFLREQRRDGAGSMIVRKGWAEVRRGR